MNKKIATTFVILSAAVILSVLIFNNQKEEPVTFISSGIYRLLTITEVINESDLIVIGKIKTILPSLWMSPGGKNITNASPQEIFEADGLFTDSLFSIEQTIKGEDEKIVIRIRSFVGETKQVRWVDDTQPSYKQEQVYLLFLKEDNGPAAQIEPGYYKAVNALQGVYEIIDGKAISATDEWVLEELIAYIQKSLSAEILSPTLTPTPAELLIKTLAPSPTQTPLLTETVSPTP